MVVDSPLALISAQDDIAEGEKYYQRQPLLNELAALDWIDEQLREHLQDGTLLLRMFACLRQELAWSILYTTNPRETTRDHMRRFCRMLFEGGSQSQQLIEFFADCIIPKKEVNFVKSLRRAANELPVAPSPQSTLDLGRAIARGQHEGPHLEACVSSIAMQVGRPLDDPVVRLLREQLEGIVYTLGAKYFRKGVSDTQRRAVIELLHQVAAMTIPAEASLPNILTHHIDPDELVDTSDASAQSLCIFVVATLRGEDVTAFYENL